jgi:hypothetical protein
MKRYGCFRGLSSEQPRGIYRWTAARGREIDGGEDTSDGARAVRVRAGRRETAGGRHGTAPCGCCLLGLWLAPDRPRCVALAWELDVREHGGKERGQAETGSRCCGIAASR